MNPLPITTTFGGLNASVSPTSGSGVVAEVYPDPVYLAVNLLDVRPIRTPNTKYTVTASFSVTNPNTGPGSSRRVGFYIAKDYIVIDNVSENVTGGTSTPLDLALDISNTFISGANYQFGFYADLDGSAVTHANDPIINFNQTPLEFNGSSSLTLFDPYVVNFDYNEYNALLDNAEIPQESVFFMDIDYSQNPLTPVNQSIILDGDADRAYVQDSNYSSKSWSNIRYNGSKYNSVKFN
jgi:hypothetical protein